METECMICGAKATDRHHLVNGSNRRIADEDMLLITICRRCHSIIHNNGKIERKSKAVGQELYELQQMVKTFPDEARARSDFMARYGKNYIT